ncbi:MAG: hypothetical protein JSV88_04810 [Candidatus Aminicenantes bacterium]|nr:MAG: hypothetical protein JSV88_04810 [Candidatus Aminicenantes bacterium]
MKRNNFKSKTTNSAQERKDRIAQWAFDTRAILGRFHLWLEDVDVEWNWGKSFREFSSEISFLEGGMERLFAMTGAVTALGTQLFGRFGEGAGLDKPGLNQVKKDADAISAYAMSESLWYLSRQLPENHAIMVCMGEGLMPKVGETPEMGSNPQLGFGRVYARPQVAKWLDQRVVKLINDEGYGWVQFYREIKNEGITVWGAAIDTLENTSRFAKGETTGPLTVLHLFDQPLKITRPYEGYMGNLFLPEEVVKTAHQQSVLISFLTPRELVLKAIEETYPGIQKENIHVWTLGGESRRKRIGGLWQEWEELGVHLVEDGWKLPSGMEVFNESGTYAPTYGVGAWTDDPGNTHLFICDGYAASAEAMQAASLAPLLDIQAFVSVFTSNFKLPYDKEPHIMSIDPDGEDFPTRLAEVLGEPTDDEKCEKYRGMIREAADAGIPVKKQYIQADDFFPEKQWEVLAVSGYMQPDPYSGSPGVEEVDPGKRIYRVTVRLAGPRGDKRITFKLRLMEDLEQSHLVFKPLLNRFMAGENFEERAVKISDSGRIRNELQTLCSEALEFLGEERMRIHFDRIPPEVISLENQKRLGEILKWYKKRHPIWFSWLEIAPAARGA